MTLTLTDLIEQQLPYGGPHSPETVEEAASGLAALVRYLNNATGPWNAPTTLQYAPTVDVVLSGIDAAAHGMDQLLNQLASTLDRLGADDSTLYDDRRDRQAAATAIEAAHRVVTAEDAAWGLATALRAARELTARLGHDPDAVVGE